MFIGVGGFANFIEKAKSIHKIEGLMIIRDIQYNPIQLDYIDY